MRVTQEQKGLANVFMFVSVVHCVYRVSCVCVCVCVCAQVQTCTSVNFSESTSLLQCVNVCVQGGGWSGWKDSGRCYWSEQG